MIELVDATQLKIEAWPPDHPRLLEAEGVVAALQQEEWATFTAAWHRSRHLLVALRGEGVVGFLTYAVQAIGSEEKRPVVTYQDQPLLEAKILAFGVLPAWRRRGIGRALQQAAIAAARAHGCYQVRSRSGGDRVANHHLKLSLGFGVHPIVAKDDDQAAYYVLPLWSFPAPSGDLRG
jgi:GNAT superfamily N-acetyltransferase